MTQSGALWAWGKALCPRWWRLSCQLCMRALWGSARKLQASLPPLLDLWAEPRSGVLKLIKELLREKLLDHPYNEWLRRNQEKLSFSLASSTNTNVHFVPDICVCSKKSPRKEVLAFFHLEVVEEARELSLLFP